MKLSICMMIKNEAKHLEECLKSLQPIRDAVGSELIIVDTGSEDNSVEIARRFTDKVYFHEWNDDFSGMRNITISYAKGEWIFIFDGDEVMAEVQPMIDFLRAPKVDKKIGAVAITGKSITNDFNSNEFSIIVTPRLFRNDGSFHYTGVVHNQPVFKGVLIEIEASLLHYGYVSTDKELMEKKFLRTSNLLKKELEKDPENLYYWYQLSVTYGMHEDYAKALEIIEQAYALFIKQGRPNSCVFVLTHLAHMYQMTRNYIKVEEVCLEAVAIRKGIIDIHYYLAEAQAVQGKYQEAINNYNFYLNLISKRSEIIERDTAIIDYTLGNVELAYFNLSNIYAKINDYETALRFAMLIKKKEYINDNFKNIIVIFIQLGRFTEMRQYHDELVLADRELYYQKLEEVKQSVTAEIKSMVSRIFIDVNEIYGLLNRLAIEDQQKQISDETLEIISKLNMEEVPLYCSDILYYLLKKQYALENLLTEFKEIMLNLLMDDIAKHHDNISDVIRVYLLNYKPSVTINGYKLHKTLCRYVLLMNKITPAQYMDIFKRYIEYGSCYLTMVYSEHVIKNVMAYELKNDEEVFLLYMYHAHMHKLTNQMEYVKYLQMAVQALPIMKTGIELTIQEIQEIIKSETTRNDEFEEYKAQVKNAIKTMLNNGDIENAASVISEYEAIVPNDTELILYKSQVMLRKAKQDIFHN